MADRFLDRPREQRVVGGEIGAAHVEVFEFLGRSAGEQDFQGILFAGQDLGEPRPGHAEEVAVRIILREFSMDFLELGGEVDLLRAHSDFPRVVAEAFENAVVCKVTELRVDEALVLFDDAKLPDEFCGGELVSGLRVPAELEVRGLHCSATEFVSAWCVFL